MHCSRIIGGLWNFIFPCNGLIGFNNYYTSGGTNIIIYLNIIQVFLYLLKNYILTFTIAVFIFSSTCTFNYYYYYSNINLLNYHLKSQ